MVFPTAFIGTLMILDYPGPPGPFGLFEFIGWWAICIAMAKLSSVLLASKNLQGLAVVSGILLPLALAVSLYLQVQPDTPTAIKSTIEYALQVLGAAVVVGLMILAIRLGGKSRQYH